jgi:MFS family permease
MRGASKLRRATAGAGPPARIAGLALVLSSLVLVASPALRIAFMSAERALAGRGRRNPRSQGEPLRPGDSLPAVAPAAPVIAAVDEQPDRRGSAVPLTALRHRNYRLYWFGTWGWIMGEFFRFLAQAWLIFELTGDAFYLGLVSALGAGPTIVLAPIAGVLADRLDRRRILMTAQTITGAFMVLVGLLIMADRVEVWHLLLASFLTGCFQALDEPARQSLVPSLVPTEDLPSAISLGNSLWSVSQVAAPALAGFMLAFVGAGPCYFVTAAGFWLSVVMFSFVRVPKRERGERHNAWQEMRAGFSFVRHNRVLLSLLLLSLTIGAFGYAVFVLAPVFATEVFDVGAIGLGVMEAMAGIGGLAGTLLAATLGFHRRRGLILITASTTFGLLLVAYGVTNYFPIALAVLLGIGFFDGIFINLALTVGQLSLPDDLRGRVMGIWGLTWFMPPFGGMLGGVMAESIGAPATVAIFGGVVAAMALLVGAPGVRGLGRGGGAAGQRSVGCGQPGVAPALSPSTDAGRRP